MSAQLPPGYRVFARDTAGIDAFKWRHCEGPGLPKPPRAYAYPSEAEAIAACWSACARQTAPSEGR